MAEIHLSGDDRAFIAEQVKDGRYKSAEDVVAARILKTAQERQNATAPAQNG